MELKLKYSKWLPFGNYYAITIFNNLIRRDKYKNRPISKTTYNHDSIHLQQELDFDYDCKKKNVKRDCMFYIIYFFLMSLVFLL